MKKWIIAGLVIGTFLLAWPYYSERVEQLRKAKAAAEAAAAAGNTGADTGKSKKPMTVTIDPLPLGPVSWHVREMDTVTPTLFYLLPGESVIAVPTRKVKYRVLTDDETAAIVERSKKTDGPITVADTRNIPAGSDFDTVGYILEKGEGFDSVGLAYMVYRGTLKENVPEDWYALACAAGPEPDPQTEGPEG